MAQPNEEHVAQPNEEYVAQPNEEYVAQTNNQVASAHNGIGAPPDKHDLVTFVGGNDNMVQPNGPGSFNPAGDYNNAAFYEPADTRVPSAAGPGTFTPISGHNAPKNSNHGIAKDILIVIFSRYIFFYTLFHETSNKHTNPM